MERLQPLRRMTGAKARPSLWQPTTLKNRFARQRGIKRGKDARKRSELHHQFVLESAALDQRTGIY